MRVIQKVYADRWPEELCAQAVGTAWTAEIGEICAKLGTENA